MLLEGLCDIACKLEKNPLTRSQGSLVPLASLIWLAAGAGHNSQETSTTLRKELVTEFNGEEFDVSPALRPHPSAIWS